MQSDVTRRARAASTADNVNDESEIIPPRQNHKLNRFSALIREATRKRHRRVVSESGLLATTPRDPEEEAYLWRPRSAVLHSPLRIPENRDTQQQEAVEPTQPPDNQRAHGWTRSLVRDKNRLGAQLLTALISEFDTHRKFLPKGKLDQLVTQNSVERELSRLVYLPTKILHHTWRSPIDIRIESTAEVNGAQDSQTRLTHPHDTNQLDKTCYKQIFAILLFMRRPRKIWSFVRELVSDADLPLEDGIFGLRRRGEMGEVLKCLKKQRDIDQFLKCQWQVLVPFFREPDGRHDSHLKVSDNQILPFTYWEYTSRQGGSGNVHKAVIHPDHHEFDKNEARTLTRASIIN